MLTTRTLGRGLVVLGFKLIGRHYHRDGLLQVQLLDGPRLLLRRPGTGLRYVAVLSLQHLAQEVAAFGGAAANVHAT